MKKVDQSYGFLVSPSPGSLRGGRLPAQFRELHAFPSIIRTHHLHSFTEKLNYTM